MSSQALSICHYAFGNYEQKILPMHSHGRLSMETVEYTEKSWSFISY